MECAIKIHACPIDPLFSSKAIHDIRYCTHSAGDSITDIIFHRDSQTMAKKGIQIDDDDHCWLCLDVCNFSKLHSSPMCMQTRHVEGRYMFEENERLQCKAHHDVD